MNYDQNIIARERSSTRELKSLFNVYLNFPELQ